MSKIVGLNGRKISECGADEGLIKLARELLADAERGEIIGLAAVTVLRNHEIRTRAPPSDGMRHLMLAGAIYLQHDLAKDH